MNRIKEIADEKGIKVSEIIQNTGLAKSYVYDCIKGASVPTIPTARKIAKALESTIDEVFPET